MTSIARRLTQCAIHSARMLRTLLAMLALTGLHAVHAGQAIDPNAEHPRVLFATTLGNFTVELYPEAAPVSVDNFLQYVRSKFYDTTIFHRVIGNFVAQGGGFDTHMRQKKTRDPIMNESQNGLSNEAGTLAMARTGAPHSATSQFFINLVDNKNLDYPSFDGWGYAVFGRVIDGAETIRKMAQQATGMRDAMADVPLEPIIVNTARVVTPAQKP